MSASAAAAVFEVTAAVTIFVFCRPGEKPTPAGNLPAGEYRGDGLHRAVTNKVEESTYFPGYSRDQIAGGGLFLEKESDDLPTVPTGQRLKNKPGVNITVDATHCLFLDLRCREWTDSGILSIRPPSTARRCPPTPSPARFRTPNHAHGLISQACLLLLLLLLAAAVSAPQTCCCPPTRSRLAHSHPPACPSLADHSCTRTHRPACCCCWSVGRCSCCHSPPGAADGYGGR